MRMLPQIHSSQVSSFRPFARSLASSSRRKRDRPTAVADVQAAGAGSIAGVRPVGQCQGKRRCRARRPQEKVFFNTPLPSVCHDYYPGVATSATRSGIAVSARINAESRRSRRLQGLSPATAGRICKADSVPQNTDETSSSALAPCILLGLVDAASTPLAGGIEVLLYPLPLVEPISSLHDDGLPFDRG